jgi:hypothetical protein
MFSNIEKRERERERLKTLPFWMFLFAYRQFRIFYMTDLGSSG